MFLSHQIEKAPGTANQDFHAFTHVLNLGISADSAIDGSASHIAFSTQGRNGLMHLFGKLSGRFYDKNTHSPVWVLSQVLQNREDKCRSFPGSGLGQSHNIAALQYQWNRLLLYLGWLSIASGEDGGIDIRIKGKLIKTQKILLGCMSQVALSAHIE
jgi:hypothetical protein